MKILMTGFTPRAVGSSRLLYTYMSNTSVIQKGLIASGHEVDRRVVSLDETDLATRYDVAFIGVAVPQSLSSRFWFSALWAAEQFGPGRTRFFVDDWLLFQFKNQLESGLRNPVGRFYALQQRWCYEQAKAYTPTWCKWCRFLAYESYKLLIPAFPWVNMPRLLSNSTNVTGVIFDPTPMAFIDPEILYGETVPVKLPEIAPEQRQRVWILAAFRDITWWLERTKFNWPVIKYGNKRLDEEILTERQLLNSYARHWGIIAAPYPAVDGAGGWRARYVHAALTNSILSLSPADGKVAGGPYDIHQNTVERMSTEELIALALAQREYLQKNTWSLDELIQKLDAYARGEL
jgi:hypothetical protein